MGRGLGQRERWRISTQPSSPVHLPDLLPAVVTPAPAEEPPALPGPHTTPPSRRRRHPIAPRAASLASPDSFLAPPTRGTYLVASAEQAPALDRTLRGVGIATPVGPADSRGRPCLDVDDHHQPTALLLGFGDEGTAFERGRPGADLWPDPDGRGVWLAWRDASPLDGEQPPEVALLTFDLAFGLLEQLLALVSDDDGADARAERSRRTLADWQRDAAAW